MRDEIIRDIIGLLERMTDQMLRNLRGFLRGWLK